MILQLFNIPEAFSLFYKMCLYKYFFIFIILFQKSIVIIYNDNFRNYNWKCEKEINSILKVYKDSN